MTSSKQRVIPPDLPTWICKCMWDSTAMTIKVVAKDEATAWDKAWKLIAKTEGGMSCISIKVIRRLD